MHIPEFEEIIEQNDQTEARREHLDALRALVGNVYPNKFTRSAISGTEDTITNIVKYPPVVEIVNEIRAVVATLAERERPPVEIKDALNARLREFGNVRISGRLAVPPRVMGKAAFVHLSDGMSRLQIYVRRDDVKGVYNGSEPGAVATGFRDGGDKNPVTTVPGSDPNGWEIFQLLDHGDFIGVEGYLFITNTGELSVHVEKLQFLAKAMLPMPDKMHGIADAEIKQRQRYVDLIGSSLQVEHEGLTTREVFEVRAKTISSMRNFLEDHGYIEVETPMLTPKATGAAAKPFKTHHNALDIDLYARIAPELYLKRLVVGGFEKVYELNRNFRNEGISYKHNPEFTMLEFYCAYMDVEGMMNFCEELMRQSVQKATGGSLAVVNTNTDPRVLGYGSKYEVTIDFSSFVRMTMEDAIASSLPALMDWYFRHVNRALAPGISDWLSEQIGVDHKSWFHTGANSQVILEQLNWLSSFDNLMNEVIELNEYNEPRDVSGDIAASSIKVQLSTISATYETDDLSPSEITHTVLQVFESHVEKVLGVFSTATGPVVRPTFIVDYPKSISPLSKASPDNPNIAERFELFINGMEVANGFSELNDPREQYDRFIDQMSLRIGGDEEAMILDEDYIRALSYGMPPAAGIGIGIDRLVMLLTNRHSIRDVILFPHMRPEKGTSATEYPASTEAE